MKNIPFYFIYKTAIEYKIMLPYFINLNILDNKSHSNDTLLPVN